MLKTQRFLAAVVLTGVLAAGTALAAKPDAYQVTGPVVEVNSSVIVVMKGKERFEVARDTSTKMPADVKVGDKVTIHYRMMATEVESKGAPAAAKPKAKKAA
ncbi:MAG: hypothetical protein M3S32_00715 [Acidobacteriota bacterium]|nr:hypothetical protein [Acidobacteriota bacterium]